MSTDAVVDLVVHRWCDGTNLRSDPFRHGTWYGVDPTTIERYRNDDPGMRLGGARLVSGTIRAENPHCVDLARSRVLHDAWEMLPYGDDMREIAFAKERSEIRRVLARIAPDADDRARFRGMPSQRSRSSDHPRRRRRLGDILFSGLSG